MSDHYDEAQYEDVPQQQQRNEVTIRADARPVDVGLLRANSPREMVQQAEQIASPLAEIIERQQLFVELGNGRHVRVEGWTTMLAMLGITPVERRCERIHVELKHPVTGDSAQSTYFESHVELRRVSDGAVIGGASAECGGPDEIDWHYRPKKEYHLPGCPVSVGQACTCDPGFDRRKVPVVAGYAPVQPNARRSMAQTRATSKAARLSFSWIVELAGFKATPAEEMTGAFAQEPIQRDTTPAPAPSQSQPASAPQQQRPSMRGPKRMPAKFASKQPCPVCGEAIDAAADPNNPQPSEEIAYERGKPVLHWACYVADQPQAPASASAQDDDLPF